MPRTNKENIFLKFRVIATKPLRVGQAVNKLKQALRTGYVPDGIEIIGMDWRKGEGYRFRSGSVPGPALDEMRLFYRALMKSDIRVRRAE